MRGYVSHSGQQDNANWPPAYKYYAFCSFLEAPVRFKTLQYILTSNIKREM